MPVESLAVLPVVSSLALTPLVDLLFIKISGLSQELAEAVGVVLNQSYVGHKKNLTSVLPFNNFAFLLV